MNGKIVYSKMASAMIKAVDNCIAEGRNPGRVGRIVITNKAAGVGAKWQPRLTLKNKHTAVSAGK